MFQCVKPFRSGRQQSEDGRPAGLWTSVIDHFFPFELFVLLCLEVFAACVNFLAPRPQIVELIRQYGLTTKARRTRRVRIFILLNFVTFVTFVVSPLFFAFFAVKSSVWDGYSRPIICDLCTTIVESFRGLRKISELLQPKRTGIDSRQGAKHAKFGWERLIILQTIFTIFLRPLRPWRLGARYS